MVQNNGTARALWKGNGDAHFSNTSITALDGHDDGLLVRELDLVTSTKGIIETRWDEFVERSGDRLREIGVLSSEGDFIVVQPILKLHNGAIWQQRAMFETMKSVAEEMVPGFAARLNERLAAQSLPALPA